MNIFEQLPYESGKITRQISAENPTGEKGGGCKWIPGSGDPMLDPKHSAMAEELGEGWKVRPFIRVAANTTVTLADIDGPGVIKEIYFTTDYDKLSEMVLRFYWDSEEEPSVEVPAGAFFCIGHDLAPHTVNSFPVTVAPYRGCNCYWSMPFRKHARITLTHEGSKEANVVAYRILYDLCDISDNAAYFHAQYRRTNTTSYDHPEHIILDGVKGSGVYVGTYLAYNVLSSGWWGEGEVKFYIDGDTKYPTLCDNGTEDYFGGAWNFGSHSSRFPGQPEQVFNTPFLGMPLARVDSIAGPHKFSLYRWHLLDSIGFREDLKVTIQALGYNREGYRPLQEDITSVAYWYQSEPHNSFPALLPKKKRWDR